MFDQSFSAKNFRRIFDYANRKGLNPGGRYFPEVASLSKQLKDNLTSIRDYHQQHPTAAKDDNTPPVLQLLYDQRRNLKKTREEALETRLTTLSSDVTSKDFHLEIKKRTAINHKDIYVATDCASAFFTSKQLQTNITRLYKVRQANRHQIVRQVRELLNDKLPKCIIKADISSFYESIPRNNLLKQLDNDSLLTLTSRAIIKRIMRDYGSLSGNPIGLPRGIGVSAYLAELYMRDFDRKMRDTPGVLFYARYVDDIFIIYIPPINKGLSYATMRLATLAHQNQLQINITKFDAFPVDGKTDHKLDYLGYNFGFGRGKITVTLSQSRLQKYKTRIDLSFAEYLNTPPNQQLRALPLLIRRMKFLTSNTRLGGNKSNALVGIFHSHSLLDHPAQLNCLDRHLRQHARTLPPKPRSRIMNMSFKTGFESRLFHHFSPRDLAKIVRVWKNAT